MHFKTIAPPSTKIYLLILILVCTTQIFAQVVIKDSVEITPIGRITSPNRPKSFNSNFDRPIYLRIGGVVGLTGGEQINGSVNQPLEEAQKFKLFCNDSRILQDAANSSCLLGPFMQWSTLSFYMTYPDPQYYTCDGGCPSQVFPQANSVGILGGYSNSDDVLFNPGDPESIFSAFRFPITLIPDSAKEAIPPPTVLNDTLVFGNPFLRTLQHTLTIPVTGNYRIRLETAKLNSHDDIKLLTPIDTVLLSDAANNVGVMIELGELQKGYQLTPAILSHVSPLVEGTTMFPKVSQIGSGKWMLRFEDWTDLTFDDVTLYVEPSADPPESLHVVVAEGIIWYGDTVALQIVPMDGQGRYSPLETSEPLKYSIELTPDGQQYGSLLYNGELVNMVEGLDAVDGIGKGVSFVSTSLEPIDTVQVLFHAKAYTDAIIFSIARPQLSIKIKKKIHGQEQNGIKKINPSIQPLIGGGSPIVLMENDRTVPLTEKTILLGESKFFYLQQDVNGELILKETSAPTSDALNPTEFTLTAITPSDTLAVYYEYKKPLYTGNTFTGMGPLPKGYIRLIGRYWTVTDDYKVQLTATYSGKTQSVYVKVKKPGLLGNKHNTIDDVKSQPFNLDELLITYGGKHGILPQMIKGQIEQETIPIFTPSYRYEPFSDLAIQLDSEKNMQYFKSTLPFIVSINPNSMGGSFPTGHINVTPIPYPKIPIMLADYLANHFSEYVDLDQKKVIGIKEQTKKLTEELNNLYLHFVKKYDSKKISERQITIKARDSLALELQQDSTLRKSFNQASQTRVVASYGFIQMMYTTAVVDKFEETGNLYGNAGTTYMKRDSSSQQPELLNEYAFAFPQYVDFTLKNLRSALKKKKLQTLPENNWDDGFEKVWCKTFQLHNKWRKNYGNEVISKSVNYEPRSEN
ncbi:MAG: hypothetical protein PHP42_06205 [Bacteroidota bacterium]|nr:hypothetical protein [Bacteroidota bacterium]